MLFFVRAKSFESYLCPFKINWKIFIVPSADEDAIVVMTMIVNHSYCVSPDDCWIRFGLAGRLLDEFSLIFLSIILLINQTYELNLTLLFNHRYRKLLCAPHCVLSPVNFYTIPNLQWVTWAAYESVPS